MGDNGFRDVKGVDEVFPGGEVEVEDGLVFFGFLGFLGVVSCGLHAGCGGVWDGSFVSF